MWETEVICSACGGTHIVRADFIPRAFSYVCPVDGARVDLPYRDPSRTPGPWREVSSPSPEAIEALDVQPRGNLEI